MKLRAWTDIFISIIMLIISGYLLADASVLSLDLLSNPNLNVAIELIRFFWGVVGIIYFLYYLYHGICYLKPEIASVGTIESPKKSTKVTADAVKKPRKKRRRRRRRKRRKKRSRKAPKAKRKKSK